MNPVLPHPVRTLAQRLLTLTLTGFVCATLLTPPAMATETGSERVTLNFANADLVAVIQAVSKISGRNFVIDPRVKGSLNIVTANPVDPALTYPILLSALRLQGYAAIEAEGITKIVPEADAKLHAVPVTSGARRQGGDRVITEVFTLRNESAAQMVAVVRPLVSPNNTVVAHPGNNALVVTDYAENIGRIAQIIAAIDVAQHDVRVIALQHASAPDLAATVNRLMNDGGSAQSGDASQRLTVIGDPRSNSLLVRSDNPSRINAVRQLVASLDQPGAGGNMHVIYLKNAEATRVAQTLRAVLSGESGNATPGGSAGLSSGLSTGSPYSGVGGTSAAAGGTTPGSSSQQGSNTSSNTGSSGFGASAPQAGQSAGGIVQADAHSNALIITAPEALYHNLRRVVDQLDRRRAQVYVEALITEISTEKAAEIGIQWQGGHFGSSTVFAGTNFTAPGVAGSNILNLATALGAGSAVAPGSGLNLLLGNGTVTIGNTRIANLNMLARFLETDNQANILSTPNLVTLDNEEARIVVGKNVPFVTGSYTTAVAGASNPFTTVERKDVGLMLRVKPQISEGGTVRLQIYQEASAVIDASDLGSGPSTTKRSIESTVLVDDGAMIALGGLVEDTYSGGEQKVPVLGDIPYLGQLFRYDTRRRGKTNLIVFLRPVILRDGASLEGLSAERYDYIIGQQRRIDGGRGLLGQQIDQPELPPRGTPAPAVPHLRAAQTATPTDVGHTMP